MYPAKWTPYHSSPTAPDRLTSDGGGSAQPLPDEPALDARQPAGAGISRRRFSGPHPQERLPALPPQRKPPNGPSGDLQLSIAFANQLAAVRPSAEDGVYHVWFSRYRIAEAGFRTNPERPGVTHLFAQL